MNCKSHRIVIKIGTSTLTGADGKIDHLFIESVASQAASLIRDGMDVLIVTSGAIRAGMEAMSFTERPKTIPEKQAAAAVGQGALMRIYSDIFMWHGIVTGQVLLTRDDFSNRKRYLNIRNTLLTLFSHSVVPVINENDTVAVDEIRVGDNDNLAALVASSLQADLLILLSDVPGLYDADPTKCDGACLIPEVTKIDARIKAIAGGAGSDCGTGGMRTKIAAAEISMNSGVKMVIADGRLHNVITDIAEGKPVGTAFIPMEEYLCGRKRWIAFSAPVKGSISLNDGARKMIIDKGKSVLAAGITDVEGGFSAGDMVKIVDKDGNQFARGFVNYNAGEIDRIKGRHSSEIDAILGHKDFDEVIHRDNLVLQR